MLFPNAATHDSYTLFNLFHLWQERHKSKDKTRVCGMLLHSILGSEVFSSPFSPVTWASRNCWKTNASLIAECPHNQTTLSFLLREDLRLCSVSVHLGALLLFFLHVCRKSLPSASRLICGLLLRTWSVNQWVMGSKGWVKVVVHLRLKERGMH